MKLLIPDVVKFDMTSFSIKKIAETFILKPIKMTYNTPAFHSDYCNILCQ